MLMLLQAFVAMPQSIQIYNGNPSSLCALQLVCNWLHALTLVVRFGFYLQVSSNPNSESSCGCGTSFTAKAK